MIFLFGCTELFPDVPEVPEFKVVKTENLADILGFILGRKNISGKESWWNWITGVIYREIPQATDSVLACFV